MTDYDALLKKFFQYWDKKVQEGESSPLDRFETLVLQIFVTWLEQQEAESLLQKVKP